MEQNNWLPFREHHAVELLKGYDPLRGALDKYMYLYFRHNKSLGSNDRREISFTVYGLVRWRGLLDHLCGLEASFEERITTFLELDLEETTEDSSIPLLARLSCPENLWELLVKSLGEDQAEAVCRVNNEQAPLTLRANLLKTNRNELLEKLSSWAEVAPCEESPWAIHFLKRCNFFDTDEFRKGFFEVQDAGSQNLAMLVQTQPGQQVLDYCAGSGGKALAVAPLMKQQGQLYLHDVREEALYEARKRLKRAGVQNAQLVFSDSPKLDKLKKGMDWVLVDAPCSGTGTYRRNPDMKWKFSKEDVQRLVGLQRTIFERALSFVKENGHIVYATCSVLREENDDQLSHFLRTYDLEVVGSPFRSLPSSGGMDGFFGVVFKKLVG